MPETEARAAHEAGDVRGRIAALAERERVAPANGIEIAYDEIGDPDGAPLLLMMGLATQLIAWDERFCGLLADRGYRVIRFDNRDVGHSTTIDAPMPSRAAMFAGVGRPAYLLSDMAGDTVGLIDHLGIERAHVVGVSMGGMIAQTLAIEHPQRVLSLCSMLSTTGSRWLRMPKWKAMATFLVRPPRTARSTSPRALAPSGRSALRPTRPTGAVPDHVRGRLRPRLQPGRRGPAAARDQLLRQPRPPPRRLRMPATVIHGRDDPLVRPAAGRATARAIPGARLSEIPGMGHDLPPRLWPKFVEEIDSNANRASVARLP